MRCYYCDFCPTAPSISTLNPRRSVQLFWDEKLKGWTCKSNCGSGEEDNPDKEDILEVLDGRTYTKPIAVSES